MTLPEHTGTPPFRCGYVAIVGEPNVGKSTLMNRFLAQKISIVTRKPQTTRHRILGILTTPSFQAVFLDTPGIITPRYALHEAMMASASSAVDDADLILLMVDASRPSGAADPAGAGIRERISRSGKPAFLLLNKVDVVEKAHLLPMIAAEAARGTFREIYPISALTGEGTGELLTSIAAALPVHPPFYPPDIVSDHHERFFVAEIIREKIFNRCREEVPYATTVEITEFAERGGGTGSSGAPKEQKWFIRAEVYVERESQKGILIGKQGAMLREIGELARRDIERFLQHGVFLELLVKVREGWRGDRQWLESKGYRS